MCDLCNFINNKCENKEGKTYICKCLDYTYYLVHVDEGDCRGRCSIEIKYCPRCGRKLGNEDV